jgi:hypothetical protein
LAIPVSPPPAAAFFPLRGNNEIRPLTRAHTKYPSCSTLRLSLSLDGLLRIPLLKPYFMPQPRAGFHSRPRISPPAQPFCLIGSLLPPCCFQDAASPPQPCATSRSCSTQGYVLRRLRFRQTTGRFLPRVLATSRQIQTPCKPVPRFAPPMTFTPASKLTFARLQRLADAQTTITQE